MITQIAMLLKPHTSRMSPTLRSAIEKLINATKEFTILLSVSSFAPPPTPRPFSPAFTALAPVPEASTPRGTLGAPVMGRSRSATATQEAAPRVLPLSQLKEVPWSAMPHQGFKVPKIPLSQGSTSLSSQRLEEDEKPLRRP